MRALKYHGTLGQLSRETRYIRRPKTRAKRELLCPDSRSISFSARQALTSGDQISALLLSESRAADSCATCRGDWRPRLKALTKPGTAQASCVMIGQHLEKCARCGIVAWGAATLRAPLQITRRRDEPREMHQFGHNPTTTLEPPCMLLACPDAVIGSCSFI